MKKINLKILWTIPFMIGIILGAIFENTLIYGLIILYWFIIILYLNKWNLEGWDSITKICGTLMIISLVIFTLQHITPKDTFNPNEDICLDCSMLTSTFCNTLDIINSKDYKCISWRPKTECEKGNPAYTNKEIICEQSELGWNCTKEIRFDERCEYEEYTYDSEYYKKIMLECKNIARDGYCKTKCPVGYKWDFVDINITGDLDNDYDWICINNNTEVTYPLISQETEEEHYCMYNTMDKRICKCILEQSDGFCEEAVPKE